MTSPRPKRVITSTRVRGGLTRDSAGESDHSTTARTLTEATVADGALLGCNGR